MNLRERPTLRFTDRVISTPEGREARGVADHGRAGSKQLFDRGWVAVGFVEKWFWKAIHGLSIRGELPLTAFAHSEVAS